MQASPPPPSPLLPRKKSAAASKSERDFYIAAASQVSVQRSTEVASKSARFSASTLKILNEK